VSGKIIPRTNVQRGKTERRRINVTSTKEGGRGELPLFDKDCRDDTTVRQSWGGIVCRRHVTVDQIKKNKR